MTLGQVLFNGLLLLEFSSCLLGSISVVVLVVGRYKRHDSGIVRMNLNSIIMAAATSLLNNRWLLTNFCRQPKVFKFENERIKQPSP